MKKYFFKLNLSQLVFLGLVIAIKIILGRFSVGPELVKVGLGFIGSVALGYFFGPIWGAVGGGVSDLVSSALFGNQGGFFIGFAFLGSVALGYLVGPWWGVVGGFSSVLVYFIIFGDKANFLFASLTPLIYGLFLYKYPLKFWRVVVAQLVVSVLINIVLTSFLYAWQNGLSIEVAFIQRLPKEILLPWGQMILSYLLLCNLVRIKSKVINFNS